MSSNTQPDPHGCPSCLTDLVGELGVEQHVIISAEGFEACLVNILVKIKGELTHEDVEEADPRDLIS